MSAVQLSYVGGYSGEGPSYSHYGAYSGGYDGYGGDYQKKYYKRDIDLGLNLVDDFLGILYDDTENSNVNSSNVIVQKLIMPVEGRKDLVIDFTKDTMQAVRFKQPYTYFPVLEFKVRKDVKGLRYLQTATRAGILIESLDTNLGDFDAKSKSYNVKMPSEEAPDGVQWQGDFSMKSRVVDEDYNVYLEATWDLIIDDHW